MILICLAKVGHKCHCIKKHLCLEGIWQFGSHILKNSKFSFPNNGHILESKTCTKRVRSISRRVELHYENLPLQDTEIIKIAKKMKISSRFCFYIFLIFAQNIDFGYRLVTTSVTMERTFIIVLSLHHLTCKLHHLSHYNHEKQKHNE